MKLLSCIGIGDLHKTTYTYQGELWKTPIIQEALCHFFPVSEIIIFATEKSRTRNGQLVTSCLQDVSVKIVDIPDGKSEDELWKIFSLLVDEVKPRDEILFDITHGFRSLPFIAFLTVAYLKEVKNAKIKGILYGAFDARENDVTPIFDLTPFASILDWMAAVRSFLVHSDASGINDQICEITRSFHLSGVTEDTPDPVFSRFSRRLDTFSLAVRLSRPIEGVSVAYEIGRLMPLVTDEITRYSPALVPVLGKIGEIERFSSIFSNRDQSLDQDHILKQQELILYQVEHGLYIQAVTMTREWMVSVLIFAAGKGEKWLDKDTRYDAERTLSGAERQYNNEPFEKSDLLDKFLLTAYCKDVTKEWSRLSQVRNDLAHCGMNIENQKAASLRGRVCKTIPSALEIGIKMMHEGL